VGKPVILWSAGSSDPANQSREIGSPRPESVDIVGVIENQRRRADDVNPGCAPNDVRSRVFRPG
jgi:hypothetical protein